MIKQTNKQASKLRINYSWFISKSILPNIFFPFIIWRASLALSRGKTLKRCGWSCFVVYNSQRESIHYFASDAIRLPSELLQDDSSNTLQDRFLERYSSLQASDSQVFAESIRQKSQQQQDLSVKETFLEDSTDMCSKSNRAKQILVKHRFRSHSIENDVTSSLSKWGAKQNTT